MKQLQLWFVTLLIAIVLQELASEHDCREVGRTTLASFQEHICIKRPWNETKECKRDSNNLPETDMHCNSSYYIYCNATAKMWTSICERVNMLLSANETDSYTVNLNVNVADQLFGTATTNPDSSDSHDGTPSTDDANEHYFTDLEGIHTSETATTDSEINLNDCNCHPKVTDIVSSCPNHPTCNLYMNTITILGCISGVLFVGIVGLAITLVWTCKQLRDVKQLLGKKRPHDSENEIPLDDLCVSNGTNFKPSLDLCSKTIQDNMLSGPTYDEISNPTKPSVDTTAMADLLQDEDNEHIYDLPKDNFKTKSTKRKANNLTSSEKQDGVENNYHVLEERERAPNGKQTLQQLYVEDTHTQDHNGLEEHTEPLPYEDVKLLCSSEPTLIRQNSSALANKSGNLPDDCTDEQGTLECLSNTWVTTKPSHDASCTHKDQLSEKEPNGTSPAQLSEQQSEEVESEHHYHELEASLSVTHTQ